MYDTTVNDEALTARMAPVLEASRRRSGGPGAAGRGVRGLLVLRQGGSRPVRLSRGHPADQDPAKAAPNHNPRFFVDEGALVVGTRTMASLAVNFLSAEPK